MIANRKMQLAYEHAIFVASGGRQGKPLNASLLQTPAALQKYVFNMSMTASPPSFIVVSYTNPRNPDFPSLIGLWYPNFDTVAWSNGRPKGWGSNSLQTAQQYYTINGVVTSDGPATPIPWNLSTTGYFPAGGTGNVTYTRGINLSTNYDSGYMLTGRTETKVQTIFPGAGVALQGQSFTNEFAQFPNPSALNQASIVQGSIGRAATLTATVDQGVIGIVKGQTQATFFGGQAIDPIGQRRLLVTNVTLTPQQVYDSIPYGVPVLNYKTSGQNFDATNQFVQINYSFEATADIGDIIFLVLIADWQFCDDENDVMSIYSEQVISNSVTIPVGANEAFSAQFQGYVPCPTQPAGVEGVASIPMVFLGFRFYVNTTYNPLARVITTNSTLTITQDIPIGTPVNSAVIVSNYVNCTQLPFNSQNTLYYFVSPNSANLSLLSSNLIPPVSQEFQLLVNEIFAAFFGSCLGLIMDDTSERELNSFLTNPQRVLKMFVATPSSETTLIDAVKNKWDEDYENKHDQLASSRFKDYIFKALKGVNTVARTAGQIANVAATVAPLLADGRANLYSSSTRALADGRAALYSSDGRAALYSSSSRGFSSASRSEDKVQPLFLSASRSEDQKLRAAEIVKMQIEKLNLKKIENLPKKRRIVRSSVFSSKAVDFEEASYQQSMIDNVDPDLEESQFEETEQVRKIYWNHVKQRERQRALTPAPADQKCYEASSRSNNNETSKNINMLGAMVHRSSIPHHESDSGKFIYQAMIEDHPSIMNHVHHATANGLCLSDELIDILLRYGMEHLIPRNRLHSSKRAEDLDVSGSWCAPGNPKLSRVTEDSSKGKVPSFKGANTCNFPCLDLSGHEISNVTVKVSDTEEIKSGKSYVQIERESLSLEFFVSTYLDLTDTETMEAMDEIMTYLERSNWASTKRRVYIDFKGPINFSKGCIRGDSYSLALILALFGCPAGPVITGRLREDGTIEAVGAQVAKVGAFVNRRPMIVPKDCLKEDMEDVIKTLIQQGLHEQAETVRRLDEYVEASNVSYNLFNPIVNPVYTVSTIKETLALFTTGGFAGILKNAEMNAISHENFHSLETVVTPGVKQQLMNSFDTFTAEHLFELLVQGNNERFLTEIKAFETDKPALYAAMLNLLSGITTRVEKRERSIKPPPLDAKATESKESTARNKRLMEEYTKAKAAHSELMEAITKGQKCLKDENGLVIPVTKIAEYFKNYPISRITEDNEDKILDHYSGEVVVYELPGGTKKRLLWPEVIDSIPPEKKKKEKVSLGYTGPTTKIESKKIVNTRTRIASSSAKSTPSRAVEVDDEDDYL